MFRFNLVKDQPFQLRGVGYDHPGESDRTTVLSRRTGYLPVRIQSKVDGENKDLSELKEHMEGYPETELEWKLEAEIGFDTNPYASGKLKLDDFIAVLGATGGKNILAKLKDMLRAREFELKMSVEIKDFRSSSGGHKTNMWSSEEGIGELSGYWHRGQVGFRSDHLQYSRVVHRDILGDNFRASSGVIAVICVAHRVKDCVPKAMPSFPGSGPIQSRVVQKMLDEGLNSDATIISAEGEEIKCHKFILSGHSDVFETMFKDTSKSTTSIPGVIQMDDLCSKSVKALLAYLYLGDIG